MAAKETPDVRVGDVFQDVDARKRMSMDRRLRVRTFVDTDRFGRPADVVVLEDVQEPARVTKVRRDRLRPTATGYRLVERDGKPVA